MITHFIFTVGLPGCGKSTYINDYYYIESSTSYSAYNSYRLTHNNNVNSFADFCKKKKPNGYILISADEIKETLAGYSSKQPEGVHQQSVDLAKELVLSLSASEASFDVIMDGGGLNRHYTQGIIEAIKEANSQSKVTCLFFDTPIDVCIERVNNRERKIPMHAFYDKNLMITECLSRYRKLADEYVRIDYFTNKYIFLDMDGTIVSYRKGKLDEDGNTDFVNSKLFINANPVNHVIDFVKNNFDMNNVYIITAVANNIVLEEKLAWIDKYFPEFDKKRFLWVGNKQYKHVFLKHFAIREKMSMKDMTIIDDMHDTLTKCLSIGMNAIHPSNIEALVDKYSTLG